MDSIGNHSCGAVACGEITAPADAAFPGVDSAEALIRLLTPENRSLLRVIRDAKPQSVAALARLTNRAEPNLLRTLGKPVDPLGIHALWSMLLGAVNIGTSLLAVMMRTHR